ncbi:hypothetical protein ACFLT9_02715 [Acidobacteriota bacterium]
MDKNSSIPSIVIRLAASAGISVFLDLLLQTASYTISIHSFNFRPLPLFLFLGISFLLLSGLWKAMGSAGGRPPQANPNRMDLFMSLLPFAILLFSPLLLFHYINRYDLRLRMGVLGILVFLYYIFLSAPVWSRRFSISGFFRNLTGRFSQFPRRKKLILLFLSAFIVYNLCTFILISKDASFSGDEPFYLMTTHSLYQDQDINLWNNYARKDYFHFYERERDPNLTVGIYAHEGKKGEKFLYPINLPGISVLMLPHYAISQLFSGKVLAFIIKGSLSIWAALLGLQLFLFASERWKEEKISLLLWFLYSFSIPILFYSSHLYAEVPIALFSFYIFRKITSDKPLGVPLLILLGFVLGLFLWFGVKYNMIFFPLLLVCLYFLLKEHRLKWKSFYFLIGPAVSMGLFYFYLYELYGSFSPFSVYEGVMTPEKMAAFRELIFKLPIMLRIDTFFDYFLDQRDGLLLYSPLYLFGFLGMVEAFRKARRELILLLFIAFPFIFNYAFFTHRQGSCPQGRIIAPISWVAAIFIGYFLVYNKKRGFSRMFEILSVVSLIFAMLMLFNPSFLYQPTTHEYTSRPGDLFVFLSNINIFLPDFLPSFIKINNLAYVPNYIWIIGFISIVFLYASKRKRPPFSPKLKKSMIFGSLILLIFLGAAFPRTALYPTRVIKYSEQTSMGYYMGPMGKGVIAHRAAELYFHRDGAYRILFSSRKKLEKVLVKFGSLDGEYEIRFSVFDLPPFEGSTRGEIIERPFTITADYPFKWLHLYEINVHIRQISSELMLRKPFFFQIIPLEFE